MALLKEKKINWPQKEKNLIHRKGEASILFDFFSFRWLLGGCAPRPPFTSHIFSVKRLTIVIISTLVCLFSRCTYTHAFLISLIMSCIKHHHMDAYACTIFTQLHIKDIVIDIHVYNTYNIIHGFSLISIIMSCVNTTIWMHMPVSFFSKLHIKNFVIDIHVYDTYNIIS